MTRTTTTARINSTYLYRLQDHCHTSGSTLDIWKWGHFTGGSSELCDLNPSIDTETARHGGRKEGKDEVPVQPQVLLLYFGTY